MKLKKIIKTEIKSLKYALGILESCGGISYHREKMEPIQYKIEVLEFILEKSKKEKIQKNNQFINEPGKIAFNSGVKKPKCKPPEDRNISEGKEPRKPNYDEKSKDV